MSPLRTVPPVASQPPAKANLARQAAAEGSLTPARVPRRQGKARQGKARQGKARLAFQSSLKMLKCLEIGYKNSYRADT